MVIYFNMSDKSLSFWYKFDIPDVISFDDIFANHPLTYDVCPINNYAIKMSSEKYYPVEVYAYNNDSRNVIYGSLEIQAFVN